MQRPGRSSGNQPLYLGDLFGSQFRLRDRLPCLLWESNRLGYCGHEERLTSDKTKILG